MLLRAIRVHNLVWSDVANNFETYLLTLPAACNPDGNSPSHTKSIEPHPEPPLQTPKKGGRRRLKTFGSVRGAYFAHHQSAGSAASPGWLSSHDQVNC